MSSAVDKVRRPHDSDASREALLDAASALFEERGYDATTVRDVGRRAGVDPAMIARYFGSKEALYLAALVKSSGAAAQAASDPVALVERIIRRHAAGGIGPVSFAAVSPTLSDEIREQVAAILDDRAVAPLARVLREGGARNPELRAAMVLAMAVGLSLVRAGNTIPALSEATADEVLDALAPALRAMTEADS